MKNNTDPVEREKRHLTVADAFTDSESEALLQVRAGDIWTDFIRVPPERSKVDGSLRQDGTVPLLDDMTGIRQWE